MTTGGGKRRPKPAKGKATQALLENDALSLLRYDCRQGDNTELTKLAMAYIGGSLFPVNFSTEDLTRLRNELTEIQGVAWAIINKADAGTIEGSITRYNGILKGKINTSADYSNGKLSTWERSVTMKDSVDFIVISLVHNLFISLAADGLAYIGACPRCKKIFKKNRIDQLYDRNTCRIETARK